MRGKRPKPTAVRELEGNRGHRRHNRSEPQFPPAVVQDCPDWLSDAAKAEWNRLAPDMILVGMLTKGDIVAFAGYCQCYAHWVTAEEYLNTEGLTVQDSFGNTRAAPHVAIAVKMLDKIRQFASEFGCTPSARGRIELEGFAPAVETDATEEDLLAEYERVERELQRVEGKTRRTQKPAVQ